MLPNELMGLIGLAQRAGKVVLGKSAVRHEMRRSREAILLIFATDFSPSVKTGLLENAAVRPHVLEIGTMAEWGAFFGRQQVGVIAVVDKHFVAGMLRKIESTALQSGSSGKKMLRDQMRAWRRQLDPAWRAAASEAIVSRLETLAIFQQAQVIHTYVAWRNEVDNHDLIRRLLRAGRRVAVPKVERGTHELSHYFITAFSELKPGAFGILEPVPGQSRIASPQQFDLVLVPGIAFDRSGHRLGMGQGYYDRFLAQVKAPKIALAFSFQVTDRIPVEAHDQRVDAIVTEKEVINCSRLVV